MALGAAMVLTAKELSGAHFAFTALRHEVGDFTVDLLFGAPLLRRPGVTMKDVRAAIRAGTESYRP